MDHQLLLSKTRKELLYRLRNLRKKFEDLRPRLLKKFDIRSILTPCAENVFSEMRSGAAVLLQLEFDGRFPRALRERVPQKTVRNLSTKYNPTTLRFEVICFNSIKQQQYKLKNYNSFPT